MCTRNDQDKEVAGYRKSESPRTFVAYKALKSVSKKAPASTYGKHKWVKGWNKAAGAADVESGDTGKKIKLKQNGMVPAGGSIGRGATHCSKTYERARAWIGDQGINRIIEVIVRQQDVMAVQDDGEMAVSQVFVESFEPATEPAASGATS